jgi:hypothetical protein
MAEDEELKPLYDNAITDPVSKRTARKWARVEKRLQRYEERPDIRERRELFEDHRNFPNLPGMHMSWRLAGQGSWGLTADSNDVVSASGSRKGVLTSQGRTYVWRRVDERGFWDAGMEELVNTATNAPILRMSGRHWHGEGDTRITLTGKRELQFPVRGSDAFGLMSAIDESGKSLVEYRSVFSKHLSRFKYIAVEAVISPTALTIPNIKLLVAVSSPFLKYYFESSGSGA